MNEFRKGWKIGYKEGLKFGIVVLGILLAIFFTVAAVFVAIRYQQEHPIQDNFITA